MLPAQAPLPTDSSFPFHLRGRHPDFDLDLGIAGGFQRGGHAANGGKISEVRRRKTGKVGTAPAGKVSCPAGTACARGDGGMRQESLAKLSHEVRGRQRPGKRDYKHEVSHSLHILDPPCQLHATFDMLWNRKESI
jgi:hypothetical protein